VICFDRFFDIHGKQKPDIADLAIFYEPTRDYSPAAANGAMVKKTAATKTEKRQQRLCDFDWEGGVGPVTDFVSRIHRSPAPKFPHKLKYFGSRLRRVF
jgi:hypothetical protein